MEKYGYCAYCGRRDLKNPRVRNQKYCNKSACQRAIKRRWQRQKLATDPDYRMNQKDCTLRWRKRNPNYWKHYRSSHKSYTLKNLLLQRIRNLNHTRKPLIAKMDALKLENPIIPGVYHILRKCTKIAKMDALFQKVFIFPVDCLQPKYTPG